MFIDFLNLKNKNFTKNNLVVFYGKSGSWKSTYLDFFMNKKEFKDNIFLFHKEEKISFKKVKQKNIFIDEIVYFKQFIILFKYLFSWKRLFIATHIHPFFYKIFFFLYKWNYFFTDTNNKKIETILDEKKYKYSKESIKYFIKKYSWSFSDLEMILQNYKDENDFSIILHKFENECCVKYKNNY